MKLATLKDGSRDGQLVVVSQDLAQAHFASGIAGRLQQVLDDWNYLSPQLQELYQALNHGKARHAFAFDPALCMAPLPRAFRWALAGAAAGEPAPESGAEPGAEHGAESGAECGAEAAGPKAAERGAAGSGAGGSSAANRLSHDAGDDFLGPQQDVPLAAGATRLGCVAAWVAITGDLARGATAEQALEGIRLFGLAGLWHPLAAAMAGAAPSPPAWRLVAFAPVLATPDDLGAAWQGGRLNLALAAARNGQRCALPRAAAAPFGPLLATLTQAQRLRAGAMVGAVLGPVAGLGTAGSGLSLGDHLRLEARSGDDGASPFGAITQVVGPADV